VTADRFTYCRRPGSPPGSTPCVAGAPCPACADRRALLRVLEAERHPQPAGGPTRADLEAERAAARAVLDLPGQVRP